MSSPMQTLKLKQSVFISPPCDGVKKSPSAKSSEKNKTLLSSRSV